MEKYSVMKQLGDGTYGSVLLAVCKNSGEQVAIKKYFIRNFSFICNKNLNFFIQDEKKILLLGRMHELKRS